MEEEDYATTYRLEDGNWWFVGMRRACLDRARALLRTSAPARVPRILDVGCGTGRNLEALQGLGRTTGIDLSATALGFCQARDRERLIRSRGETLPIADASFDLVTALGVVEHIEADTTAIAEWARVVVPGGHVLVLTSAYEWLWSGHDVSNHHVRRYRAREVRRLLEGAGLVDVRVTHLDSLLLPPVAAVRLVERISRRGRAIEPRKDTAEVPGPLNRLLVAVLALEARAIRHVDLPAGVSILAHGRRPPEEHDG